MKLKLFVVLAFFCVAASANGAINLLVDPGFEAASSIPAGRPNGVEYWKGDVSSVVTTVDGITPYEGNQMVNFIYCDVVPNASSYIGGNVWQLVDLTSLSDMIDTGNAVATLSAYFNRISGDSQTDTQFDTEIRAYAGDPSTFLQQSGQNAELAEIVTQLFTDGDVVTWEYLEANLTLPVGTDFLAIAVTAMEDVVNDTSGTELDGHYVDAVSLTVVPEPTTMVLFGLAGAALARRKKK